MYSEVWLPLHRRCLVWEQTVVCKTANKKADLTGVVLKLLKKCFIFYTLPVVMC